MEFEWNEEKAISNTHKHGISFELVALMVRGAPLIYQKQERRGEHRLCLVGALLDGTVLTAIVTVRGRCVRIISGRKAHKKERGFYYDYQENIS